MKKAAAVLLAATLIAAACGDDDAALNDCDAVADATIALVQDVIDELEAMTPAEQGALLQGQEFPAFVEIGERGETIGLRAEELACTDIDAMVAERADQLVADPANGFTQLIVEGTRDGEDVLARLFR